MGDAAAAARSAVLETAEVKKNTDDDGVKTINAYEVWRPCPSPLPREAKPPAHENPQSRCEEEGARQLR